MLEDADGSLIVVDTGGWYKLCCPTSQLHKPDVLGAIYRVSRPGALFVQRSRGARCVRERLKDARSARGRGGVRPASGRPSSGRAALRDRVTGRSRLESKTALAALRQACKAERRSHARRNRVWTLTRIDDPAAREIARSLLSDPDETVRQAAIHSAGLWRDRAAVRQLVKLLESPSMHNRRAAAEALGSNRREDRRARAPGRRERCRATAPSNIPSLMP